LTRPYPAQRKRLSGAAAEVVRVLPLAPTVIAAQRRRRERTWKPGPDYRIVCDCQLHARRQQSVWRRTLRFASRGAALLVSIPLAFALFDLPTEAMNLNLDKLDVDLQRMKISLSSGARPLPIFNTPAVREQFLVAEVAPRAVTVDRFKEEYFRQHVPYGAIIFREAKRNGIPPELVAAMVHTESDFRPRLVSHKSAQGLMQIVPETAQILGVANPFDPEQNIAAGTKYFRYLLDRFDNEAVALAAYNAGEGNVERFGGVPPFPETRDYITKVHDRAHRYRQRVHNTYIAMLRVGNQPH
jgi:soluble lytic murein transglycosylase-like protein